MSGQKCKAAGIFFYAARNAARLPAGAVLRGLAWAMTAVALLSCGRTAPEVCLATAAGTRVCIGVEVARTPEERRIGLMFRKTLPERRGMLFIADTDGPQSFTMHNTIIALDMLFISRDLRVVGIVENARPLTEGPYRCDRPSRYVLEVQAGFCRRYGIVPGAGVVFSDGIR